MQPREAQGSWDAQRALLRSLVFDTELVRTRSRTITAGETFLARTDLRQVQRTAARLTTDVLARRRRGAVPLTEAFAGSVAALPIATHGDLATRFCASRWFAAHGEVPDRADQLSAEEAFYRFLCDEQIGRPELRLAEFADAMISALAVQDRAAFSVPSEIERAPFGYFALVEVSGRCLLFAAARDRVVRGPIDPTTAEVVRHRGHRPHLSAVSALAWHAVTERLASIGLDLAI